MKRWIIWMILVVVMADRAHADWQIALPGWNYVFPRDHGVHGNFKTEWWYFTGNLSDADGTEAGFQLTFFRQGIRSPDERKQTGSRWIVNDLKFAHFAVSDLRKGDFSY